jgi:hypothetical protein
VTGISTAALVYEDTAEVVNVFRSGRMRCCCGRCVCLLPAAHVDCQRVFDKVLGFLSAQRFEVEDKALDGEMEDLRQGLALELPSKHAFTGGSSWISE